MKFYALRLKVFLNSTFGIFRYNLAAVGNQSVLHHFWPYFKIFAPAVIGYVAFGKILEQDVEGFSYRSWVSSGLVVWMVVGSVFSVSSQLFSSNIRRKRSSLPSTTLTSVIWASLIPSYIGAMVVGTIVAATVSNSSPKRFIFSILITIGYMIVLTPCVIGLAFALGIMSAIARDIRMVLPYFSQYFLFASPIFYESKPANSDMEIMIRNLNPFYYLLDLYRDLQYGLGSGLVSLFAPSILSIVVIAYLNKNGSRIVLQLKYALGKELIQEEEIGY